jgi:hypothetical protein
VRIWELEYPPVTKEMYAFILTIFPERQIERYKSLLFPYGGSWGTFEYDVMPLLAYMAEGLIRCEILPPYISSTDFNQVDVEEYSSRECGWHLRLKKKATLWLRDKGVNNVQYDRSYEGGRFDVASSDREWIIECGGARPSKVYEFLPHSPRSKLVVFNTNDLGIFTLGPEELRQDYVRSHTEELGKRIREGHARIRKAQEAILGGHNEAPKITPPVPPPKVGNGGTRKQSSLPRRRRKSQ